MLKLEHNRKGHDISVRLRDRERLMSRSFLIALAIALGIHLVGVIIFSIQPFRIGYEGKVYPPAVVDADLNIIDDTEGTVVAELENQKKKGRYHLLPPESKPKLPQIPLPTLSHSFEDLMLFAHSRNPFAVLERESPSFEQKPNLNKEYYPVQVNLIGGLASLKLNGITNTPVIANRPLREYMVRYEVQVHQGEIFWIHEKEDFGDESLRQKAEAILKQLSFGRESNSWISKGTIEILISEEAS